MSREHRGQFWWDEYRGILAPGFLDMAELEYHATYLRSLQTVTLPGLLQTEEYARTLFAGVVPELPQDEVDARTEHRLRRRIIFERERSTSLEAIVHEAALRMRIGGRKVARAQLEHLLECTRLPHITLRVIPFDSETFIEATQPILYAGGVVPQLDTVRIDSFFGGRFLDADADLTRYRNFLDIAKKASLTAEKSRRIIRSIAEEM
jgi:hypothetical protein